jgi:fibronectin type 3 domain-containing protein
MFPAPISSRRLRLFAGSVAVAAISTMVILGAATSASAAVSDAPARTWATNGRVLSILPVGDSVYVGGTFTQVVDPAGHAAPASNIAVFHPSTGRFDTAWGGSTNGAVNAMDISGGTLYLGGDFSTVDGAPNRRKLAALNASTGALVTAWHPAAGGPVDALAVVGSNVYAGGPFTDVSDDTGTYAQPFIARFDATSGNFDQAWVPAPNERVRAVIGSADGSRIFIGGDFGRVDGNTFADSTASLVTTTGAVDPAFRPGPNNGSSHSPVLGLATNGTRLVVAAGGGGGACAAQDATTGATFWSHSANGDAQAVRIVGATVYCGGHFGGSSSFDGFDRNKLATINLTTGAVLPFAPVVNSALGLFTLAADATHLYVGGDFTKITGINQSFFAMFVDTAAQTVPLAPQALSADGGDGAVFLSWEPPSSDGGTKVKKYNVYRAVGAGALKKIGTTTTTVYTDNTAANGTTYTYRVNAFNALGTGPNSSPVNGTPVAGSVSPPGPPVGFDTAGQAGQILLTWSPPVSDGHAPITNYQIYRSTSTGTETPYVTVGNVTSYVDSALVFGTRYFYTVRAVNTAGAGLPSGESSDVANSGVPSPPTLAGTASAGRVTLTWNYPNDNGSPITKFVLLRDGIRLETIKSGAIFTFADTTVHAGTTYRYQIKASNAVGSSNFSNTVMITAQ